MKDKLNTFFDSPLRNTWLKSTEMSVYVRKGWHLGPDHRRRTYLDIANITVWEEFRHQGRFKTFLSLCQEIQPYSGIMVENVLNDDLRAYLERLAQEDDRWRKRDNDFLWDKDGAGGGS